MNTLPAWQPIVSVHAVFIIQFETRAPDVMLTGRFEEESTVLLETEDDFNVVFEPSRQLIISSQLKSILLGPITVRRWYVWS
jgi:hypothetical protein